MSAIRHIYNFNSLKLQLIQSQEQKKHTKTLLIITMRTTSSTTTSSASENNSATAPSVAVPTHQSETVVLRPQVELPIQVPVSQPTSGEPACLGGSGSNTLFTQSDLNVRKNLSANLYLIKLRDEDKENIDPQSRPWPTRLTKK